MSDARKYHKGSTDGKAPFHGDPLEGTASAYDVVVVGSGLAGLTGAVVLARAGRKVLLVEQHYNLGGLATWFKRRGGHIFDVSLHGFPAGMKKTCRKYWTKEIAESIVRLDGIRFDNPQFRFDTEFTREDFVAKLRSVFGLDPAAIEGFFAELGRMDFYSDSGETVGELFERHFPGRNDVHRLLLEPISYANGSHLSDPAIAYGIVFGNFMASGVYTFSGGTDKLVRSMNVERGRVRGVEAHGRVIACGAVLSNANLKATVERLVGREHFTSEYAESVAKVRLNNSSCQVYMGLKAGESIPFVTDLLFTSTAPRFDSLELCEMDTRSRTFSFYYPKTRPGLDRHAIVASTNAHWSDWNALSQADYEARKALLVERTLESVERYVPGVRAKIEHVEAATPRTFEFYVQSPEGTSFGTKFEGLKPSMTLHEEVRGLFHAGSVGIIMSGWLGAANYGVIAASKVDAWLHSLVEVEA
jgi:phytoene dehydrogenase-like protein